MKCSLGISDFLGRDLVFPILLFSSISLHWSLRKALLPLLDMLWNSAFKWEYLSFSPLPFSSVAQLCLILCDPMNRSTPGLPVHHQFLGVYPNPCPSSQWCHSVISSSVTPFSSCPQSLPASGSFPMSTLRMRWLKYWSCSFSISPPNEHPGLISFRMDWLGLLAVQGTLKSLLQHHSS